jgi:hypothetical protein
MTAGFCQAVLINCISTSLWTLFVVVLKVLGWLIQDETLSLFIGIDEYQKIPTVIPSIN